MKILEPKPKKAGIQYICENNVYVKITDYSLRSLLKEIIIGPGNHTWYWVPLNKNKAIDINSNNYTIASFNECINKSVNDIYCTVYELETYDEMIKNWDEIKYKEDNVPAMYKGQESTKATNI